MLNRKVEIYELTQSPFFRMGRNRDLSGLLRVTHQKLTRLIVQRSALYFFKEETINGKKRSLAVPVGPMRDLHERVKDLLCRIKLGEYLYSPRRNRTALANATTHFKSRRIYKLDVRQFYPSTTSEHVYQFFRYRMEMADDIAGRLTKLCTVNGKVAFGSPLSPILCALVHDDVFSEAAEICELRNTEMTLWVDDMTISGDDVSRSAVRTIREKIASKRLVTHKAQALTTRRGVVITGVFIDAAGTAPANKSHVKVRDRMKALADAKTNADKIVCIHSLIGMHNHQFRLYSGSMKDRVRRRLQFYHNELQRLQSLEIVGAEYQLRA